MDGLFIRCVGKDKKGISLIEVLVALVVFVVGILAVVRVFPGGFRTVLHSEYATVADRLAQAELERWANRAANLPAGILPWDIDSETGKYRVFSDIRSDDLWESPAAHYSGENPRYHSDVNKFRRVVAESTVIPAPVSTPSGRASVYVLGFSPIQYNPANGNDVAVYSGPLQRRPLPRDRALLRARLRGQSFYAIDYDDYDGDQEAAVLYVRSQRTGRSYRISYAYWKESGSTTELVPVVSQEVVVPPASDFEMEQGYQAVNIPDPGNPSVALKDVPGFIGIDRGSESVHRGFVNLTGTNTPFSDDPYEFKVVNTAVGIIYFNPAGYGYEEQTARGKEPLIAYIDYTVLDWHIISEERKVPDIVSNPSDGNVKLSLRFIKEAGVTVEYDGSIYGGLAQLPYADLPFSVIAVDLADGAIYTDRDSAFVVFYKDGIVQFKPEFAGHTFRIYYQAEGDWAVQTYKPYDVYTRTDSMPTHREFFVGGSNPLHVGKVFFSPCNAGTTVAVDYRYLVDGEERSVYGDSFKISLDMMGFGPNDKRCYIDLLERVKMLHPGRSVAIRGVSAVYGTSVGVRVIWHESGRALKAGRWRQKQLETNLIRAST
jgi:Tfp pilus assembly protein PilV